MTQRVPARAKLTADDSRHLLRRLTFAATPPLERLVRGQSAEAALEALLSESRRTPMPASPDVVRQPWANPALRLPGMTDEQYDALRCCASQIKAAGRST